jgi:hypothetical protein
VLVDNTKKVLFIGPLVFLRFSTLAQAICLLVELLPSLGYVIEGFLCCSSVIYIDKKLQISVNLKEK